MNRPSLRDRLGRRRSAPRTSYTARDTSVPLTSATDGRTHLIDDTEHDHAIAHRAGVFTTRCGLRVLPASLATPPGPRCGDCHSPRPPVVSLERASGGPGPDTAMTHHVRLVHDAREFVASAMSGSGTRSRLR